MHKPENEKKETEYEINSNKIYATQIVKKTLVCRELDK